MRILTRFWANFEEFLTRDSTSNGTFYAAAYKVPWIAWTLHRSTSMIKNKFLHPKDWPIELLFAAGGLARFQEILNRLTQGTV